MTDFTIPPEAVEAAVRVICAGNKWGEPCATQCVTPCADCASEVRAAIRAALAAWPEAEVDAYPNMPHLILPLPSIEGEKHD